ncbi:MULTISPECIES: MFS transporter [Kitasatospora]|uniref:Putative major facilitator superfamily transporter n=1 Tax=Kitasatospora setae (strain ATCC 33774 / DSM 43861 / JCM 3304 / KCC A-0304 / NBRC 14216 / KM-6054) TaxID=452652 RepID=E4N345_KITSK|nr:MULTISPECIES: MFS transporter [Kitasatospora]BAJ32579.1 putative major facilitator superfamily transporter [Kitasatospora setae KM-6054]
MNRHSPRLTFGVLAAGAGVYALLQSLITPALPIVQRELHTSQSAVTWVMTAYLLSASVFTPILGRIGDLVGKKRTLVGALVALLVGCLVAALAPNITVLIVARVIQGIAGALFPLSFGIIRDEFPPGRVSSGISNMSAVIAVGSGLGMVLAGPIVGALDYSWLFWLPVIVLSGIILLAHRYVPESPTRGEGGVDWLSSVLLSGWLVALLLPVSQAAHWGWGSAKVLGLLAVAVVLFAVWLFQESRSRNPLIDLRVMRLPAVWTTNTAALLFGAGMYAVWAFLPGFVQAPSSTGYGFGADVTGAGLLMLPMVAAMFVAGVLGGRLAGRFPAKAQLTTGALLGAVACALLATRHGSPADVAVAAAVFGLGIGLAFASMSNLIVHAVPAAQTGAATGMNANIRTIGGSMGAALMSSLVTSHLLADGRPAETGYTQGFALLAAFCLAAAFAALLVPARRAATPVVAAAATAATAPAAERAEV